MFVVTFGNPFEEINTQQIYNFVSKDKYSKSRIQQLWKIIMVFLLLLFSYPRQQLIRQGHCPLSIGDSYMCYAVISLLGEKSNEVFCSHNFCRSQTKQRWERQVKADLTQHWLHDSRWKILSRYIDPKATTCLSWSLLTISTHNNVWQMMYIWWKTKEGELFTWFVLDPGLILVSSILFFFPRTEL